MRVSRLVNALAFVSSAIGFGFTQDGDDIVVTTDGGLVFTVDASSGDITSLNFNGKEAQDSAGGKNSQIASGIGATCTATQGGNDNNYVKVTCTTSGITHYYVARRNDPAVHMATFVTTEPSVGELRYIARLDDSVITTGPIVSNVDGGTAIEGSDVFSVDGQTRSKFYSSVQFIDDQVHGSTGSGIGAYFIIPGTGYEKSSGGPFFRDINNQDSGTQETYFYMVCRSFSFVVGSPNRLYAELKSCPDCYRTGLFGPYALWFTDGPAPSGDIDTSFWDRLDIEGFVAESGRGRVSGTASDIPSDFSDQIAIGWSNDDAQYWTRASSSGTFTSPFMLPGTYTMSLYKNELVVATSSVSVSVGSTASSNIASEEDTPDSVIWQIGEFDGTPAGFLNADKIESMHPSDSRMSDWLVTYVVGDDIGKFPMAVFQAIGPLTIQFTLEDGQDGARTLEIGTTLAFANGRPVVTIGSFTSATPAAPDQPDSRGVTRGTWRGNNIMYTYDIPSGVLTTSGTNVLEITVASGSSGDDFLSPNFVIDSVRLS